LIYPISTLFSNQVRYFWGPSFFVPLFGKFISIITIHDLVFKLYPNTQTIFARLIGNRFIYASMLSSKRISCVSNITFKLMKKYYYNFYEKLFIASCSTDFKYESIPSGSSSSWNFSFSKKQYILYVGSLEPRKNLINLLKSFEQLSPYYQDVNLVLVASRTWSYSDFHKLLVNSSSRNKIILLDDISDKDLNKLYKNSLFTVLPSFYEGYGLTAIESLISGSNLICTTECELPYILGTEVSSRVTFFDPFKDNLYSVMKRQLETKSNDDSEIIELKLPTWAESSEILLKEFYLC